MAILNSRIGMPIRGPFVAPGAYSGAAATHVRMIPSRFLRAGDRLCQELERLPGVEPRLLSTTTIPLGKSDQSYDGLGRECIHSPDGTPDPTAGSFVGFVPLPAKEPMLHPKVLPNTDLGLAR